MNSTANPALVGAKPRLGSAVVLSSAGSSLAGSWRCASYNPDARPFNLHKNSRPQIILWGWRAGTAAEAEKWFGSAKNQHLMDSEGSQTAEEWFGSAKNQHLKDSAGLQTAEKG